MKKKSVLKKKNIRNLMMIFMVCFVFMAPVYAAALGDEDYDSHGGFAEPAVPEGSPTFSVQLDELEYSLEGTFLEAWIINDSESIGGSVLGNDSDDYYIVFNANTVTISAVDGRSFKLKGFEMDLYSDIATTLTPFGGAGIEVLTGGEAGGASYKKTINTSGNPEFSNITSFTFSGSAMTLSLDDLDFDPPVLPKYALTYNSNGAVSGTVPTGGTDYELNDTITVKANEGSLLKTGYVFAGWNTASNGSGTPYAVGSTLTMGSNDVTLYAEWTAIDYSVTYDGNGSTGGTVPTDSSAYNIGNTVTAKANSGNLVKIGESLNSWNTALNGTGTSYAVGSGTFLMGAGNVTLYAIWTQDNYGITYNPNHENGGLVPTDGANYHYNESATLATNSGTLVRTGYTYTGWNTQANSSGIHHGEGTNATITENLILYAEWTPIEYTVTYDGNGATGGTVPMDFSVYNMGINVSAKANTGNLAKIGETLSHWNTAANNSGSSYSLGSGTFFMGASNAILYGIWTVDVYALTYDANGATSGVVPTDGTSYHYDDSSTLSANSGTLARTGYTYMGWNAAADGRGTHHGEGTSLKITEDLTIYAEWAPIEYSVTYDGSGATGGTVPMDGSFYNMGITVTTKANSGSLVKIGETLSSWNTATDGSGTSYALGVGTFSMGSSNVILYAIWTQDDYAIIYDANGATSGVVPTDGANYHYNDSATLAANSGTLARTGYTYTGWNTAVNGSGTHYEISTTATVTGDMTLYAEWTGVGQSLTYDGNGATAGSVPTDGTIYATGATVTVKANSDNLVKNSYTLSSWNTESNGSGTTYAVGSGTFVMGSSDMTLYAIWVRNSSSSSGKSKDKESSDDETPPANNNKIIEVVVNGNKEMIGSSLTEEVKGAVITTVKVALKDVKNKIETPNTVLTILVPDGSDVAIGQLTGDTVKAMEMDKAVVEVKTKNASYSLPANEINIDAISALLGENVKLEDVTVNIEISKASQEEIEVIEDHAQLSRFDIVVAPIDFTVSCTYKDKKVEVHQFNAYIERKIVIPSTIDPEKITTAIVLGDNGELSHIPTKIIEMNGQYFAQISSLTNSCYTLVYNEASFDDLENHWGKDVIQDMCSRLIIMGVDEKSFEPERFVTRAEFVSIVTKGLGLSSNEYSGQYTDVQTTDAYSNAIGTAQAYDMLGLYGEDLFEPSKNMTREEAIVVVTAAIKSLSASQTGKVLDSDMDELFKGYYDHEDISQWACEAIMYCIEGEIVKGDKAYLHPKEFITYAETAVLIKRMLLALNLI